MSKFTLQVRARDSRAELTMKFEGFDWADACADALRKGYDLLNGDPDTPRYFITYLLFSHRQFVMGPLSIDEVQPRLDALSPEAYNMQVLEIIGDAERVQSPQVAWR